MKVFFGLFQPFKNVKSFLTGRPPEGGAPPSAGPFQRSALLLGSKVRGTAEKARRAAYRAVRAGEARKL